MIHNCVKHIFREHNKEADHWANVGAEGQRKVVIDRKSDAETWKAVKRLWDGNGKSGPAELRYFSKLARPWRPK